MCPESHEKQKIKQKIKDGYGPLYHRIYSILIAGDFASAMPVMAKLKTEINHFSPQVLARFEKLKGHPASMSVGDEFQIHITGPWNGPVRVTEVSEALFRLVTLEGHLEAGEIRFSLQQDSNSQVRFEIESLARSRDAVVDFVYDKLPIAKLAQTEMWTSFCQNFAKECAEKLSLDPASFKEVHVLTERQDEESGQWQKI